MKLRIDGKTYNLKKFKKKFRNYSMGKYPASTLQTYKSRARGMTKTFHKYLRRYLNNPLYLKNVFFYMFGNIYRAALGLRDTWNSSEEREHVEHLSKYLIKLEAQDRYWVRPLILRKSIQVRGLRWKDNAVKPKIKTALDFSIENVFELPAGKVMWVRLNSEEESYPHADIEFLAKDSKLPTIISIGEAVYRNQIEPLTLQLKPAAKYKEVGDEIKLHEIEASNEGI